MFFSGRDPFRPFRPVVSYSYGIFFWYLTAVRGVHRTVPFRGPGDETTSEDHHVIQSDRTYPADFNAVNNIDIHTAKYIKLTRIIVFNLLSSIG